MSWNDCLKRQFKLRNLAILWWFFQYFMAHFNIFLHFLVIQCMPDLTIGSKVFQIMFEFFCQKNHCKIGKKSLFFLALWETIFWASEHSAKSPSSLGARVKEKVFFGWPYIHVGYETVTIIKRVIQMAIMFSNSKFPSADSLHSATLKSIQLIVPCRKNSQRVQRISWFQAVIVYTNIKWINNHKKNKKIIYFFVELW